MAVYWPSSILCFCVSSRSIKTQKRTRPIKHTGILTEQAWSIKNLLYSQKDSFFLRNQGGISRVHLASSGSQSEHRIRFFSPARGFSRIINSSFSRKKNNNNNNNLSLKPPPPWCGRRELKVQGTKRNYRMAMLLRFRSAPFWNP